MEAQLKLEVGKSYVRRDGSVVRIVRNDGHITYPFDAEDGRSYQPNGREFADHIESARDIITEAKPHASELPIETDFSGDPKFSRLRNTLLRAYLQVAEGKGAARHGSDKAWPEQPMFKIAEIVGTGFHLGQALKKIEESTRLDDEAAVKELLGAISYIAAAIESIEEGHR